MAPTVRNLFESRTESYFDTTITSVGVMLSISEVLVKYDLFQYFESWFNDYTFPTYTDWKRIVRYKIQVLQLSVRHACCSVFFQNMSIQQIWSIADEYPDLVTRLHAQARLMSNFGFNAFAPWLKDTKGTLCFICKDIENTDHFLLDCPQFKENFDSIWRNLDLKIMRSNLTDGMQITNFIKGLNHQHKIMLLVGGLSLPFGHETTTMIKRYISSAVDKIYKLRTKKLRELEAPWLTS